MLQTRVNEVSLTRSSIERLPERLASVAPGTILTVVGLDTDGLRETVKTASSTSRQILQLDLAGVAKAESIVQRVLNDLADLALALWPDWYGGNELHGAGVPGVLSPWRRAASRLASSGRAPRFRHTPARIELQQLMLAVDPTGLILLASMDAEQPYAAAARIAALEWCAGNGATIVILCPTRPPPSPPFDRILYGALEITQVAAPVTSRLIAPLGKAHHKSKTEEQVRLAVLKDPELGPLFEFNKCAPTNVLGQTPCVDLLWREGRVVVELDGPEHFVDPKYGQDRHRDYELLVAGYLVLRITNAQAATDLQHAVEKIRNVVRYRQSQEGFPQ
jgi:very-short-patch-repair endonuclease